jgi:serine protease Do
MWPAFTISPARNGFRVHMQTFGLFALILALVLLNPCDSVMAQTVSQEPTPITKTIALNEPAVLLIYQEYSAIFSVPSATYQYDDQGAFHFTPGATLLTQPVRSASFGSGFTITPDGYIVTNAHVATSQGAKIDILSSLVSSALQSQLQQSRFSDQLSQNFENAYFDYLQSSGTFSNAQSSVLAYLPIVSATGNLTAQPLTADLTVAGDMTGTGTEKDVAIIKVAADHPLPTAQLGDSDSVSTGDSIVIIGYPGISASTQNIAGVESFVPTATAGIVSALKPMPEGWTVIQTDASIHHGNSGGPAFDSGGNVVGIATFVGLNPLSTSGEELSGINFLMPINIAKQFADQISIKNRRGQLDDYWQQGLENYWGQHYSAAVQDFNSVLSLYPNDPYAVQYVKLANAEINKGNEVSVGPIAANTIETKVLAVNTPIAAGAILLIVTTVVLLSLFLLRRKDSALAIAKPLRAQVRFCNKCGSVIRGERRFCTKCGARLYRRPGQR